MALLGPGDIVDGRFEIEFCAGIGGMGRVYRARDLQLSRPVALKVMAVTGGAHRERFAREVRLLSSLHHPGIVRYVAHGVLGHEDPYLAMDWVSGSSLGMRVCGEPLGVREALALMRRLCDALAEAHARGIVHRDLKPANILLEEGDLNRPRILDFGLARVIDTTHAITRTGVLLGTPAYMAPEQARKSAELDARADVFALGCIFFECLVGHAAFRGSNVVAVLCKVLLEEPPPLRELRPDVPEGLARLISLMLEKDADARPRDALAVRELLDAEFDGVPGEAPEQVALGSEEQRYLSVILAGCPGSSFDEAGATQLGTPRFLVGLQKAVESFDADVSHLVDSTIMLTLRGRGSATDRAARAARCALAMRDLVPHLPVVMATRRGMLKVQRPVGAVIDEAARLLAISALEAPSASDGGPVMIDAVSASLLDVRFELRPHDSGHVLLLAFRTESVEPRKLLGRSTPCVGRTRELSTLRAVWEECVEEGLARPILVTGPPGIGKTRLLREWISELRSVGSEASVHVVRADPMGTSGAFGMLSRLVRDMIGALPHERGHDVREKLRATVEGTITPEQRARVCSFLADMLGVAADAPEDDAERAARHNPVLRGDQIRRAFQDFVASALKRAPMLLVLEDVQWADTPSVELIDDTLRNLTSAPLCVVGLARPEVEERFPRLWSERSLTSFSLGPLRFRAAVQLVCAALERVDDARAELIARRSGGSPFFLEELIRAEAEGRVEHVPETLLAVIQARLDELNPSLRRVLRAASVFGDAFSESGVAALLAGNESDDLPHHIEALIAREVVVATAERAGSAPLSFAQGLWREAAYDTLTDADRKLGHALAADYLARSRPSAALMIAEHYARGERTPDAAPWFGTAARQALEGGDYRMAVSCCERALQSDAGPAPDVWLVRAEAHKWSGENQAAAVAAEAAARVAQPGTATFFAALGELASASGKLGQVQQLEAVAERLLKAPPALGDAALAATMAESRAVTQLVLAGRLGTADALLARLNDDTLDPSTAGWVFEARAVRAGSAGDPAARVAMARHAAEAFRAVGDDRNACLQLTSVGFALNEAGVYADAQLALREAVAIAERMGLQNALATAQAQQGRALVRLRAFEQAESALRTAISVLSAQGNQRLEGVARLYLAWLLHDAARGVMAEAEARRAMSVLANAETLWASASAILCRILLAGGRIDEAVALSEEAMAIYERVGSLPMDEALVLLARAEALLARGERAAAVPVLQRGAARLEVRASQLTDPAQREAFVAIPEHARTFELHRALS